MSAVYDLSVELCKILKANYDRKSSGVCRYDFLIEEGRKYYKIVQRDANFKGGSVHAFVDKVNGDLYKAASWSAPAKGVRFNLEKDLEVLRKMGESCGAMWAGGYLYR